MSEITYLYIPINEMFTLKRGFVISKAYIKEHIGIYPVFSSQTKENGILGYIDTYMYDGEYITWTTDGVNAGTTFYRNGKFNCTNVCGIMALTEQYKEISLKYVSYLLDFRGIAKSSGNKKVMSDDIIRANISIPVPIRPDGTFDAEVQEELAEKYQEIEERRKTLIVKAKKLEEAVISFENEMEYREVRLNSIFKPQNGNSNYTKNWCNSNKGEYPLYSGNTEGRYDCINRYDYDGEYLTWSKDGLAGYLMYHNGKFSITGHRGILIPVKELINIDLKYVKYCLEPHFRKNVKGRVGENGKNEYTTLNLDMLKKLDIKIPVPVKADGSFDLSKQKEVAEKYEQINAIKKELIEKIKNLASVKVQILGDMKPSK